MKVPANVQRKLTYKPLGGGDMKKVVELHKRAFAPDQLRRTIFCSSRVHRFLASLVSYPKAQRAHQFLGAWFDQDLVGYAHYRVLKNSLHLNQIVVHPDHQGKGIGRRLVDEWWRRARELDLPFVSLDVNADNTKPYEWYLRIGLNPVSKTYLYERKVIPKELSKTPVKFRLLDWENTIAWQSTYGFSTIRIEYKSKVWEVGWICKTLRVNSAFPEELFAGLFTLVPAAKWLLLRSSESAIKLPRSPGDWRLAGVIVRMRAPLEGR